MSNNQLRPLCLFACQAHVFVSPCIMRFHGEKGLVVQYNGNWHDRRDKTNVPINDCWWFRLLNSLTLTALAWPSPTTALLDSAALRSLGSITDGSRFTNVWQAWTTETTVFLAVSWYFTTYQVPGNGNQSYATTRIYLLTFSCHQINVVSNDDLPTSYHAHVYLATT